MRALAAAGVVLIGLVGLMAQPRARADEDNLTRTEAGVHYDRGKQLFRDGDFVAAALEFSQAERMFATLVKLSQATQLDQDAFALRRASLSNEATAYSQAALPVEALDAFALLRSEYETTLTADERSAIDDAIAALRARIGTIRLQKVPSRAQVRIDGRLAPDTITTQPFRVAAGDHALEIEATGYQPYAGRFTVAATETVDVEPKLIASAAPARVRVESVIEPATVWLDGKKIGDAPVELDEPMGKHAFKVTSESYLAQTGDFEAIAGEHTLIHVSLVPKRTPIGMRLEPYFGGYFMNRQDTPVGFGGLGFGLRLFHDYARAFGLQFGVDFLLRTQKLDQYGFGLVMDWCPDKLTFAKGQSRWCPVNLTTTETFGGTVGQFTGGDQGVRIATAIERDFSPLFFRFAIGEGMDPYKRSGLVSLFVTDTYIEVSIGFDL